QHLFSAAEVRAYLDAVARHQDQDGEGDGDDDGWDEDEWDPAGGTADGLREVVAQSLREGRSTAALALPEALEAADDAEAAGLAPGSMVAGMLAWLTGARERGGQPATTAMRAVDWVREHLGGEVADDALILAGVLGHPRSPDLTVAEAFDRAGEDLVPLLLWL